MRNHAFIAATSLRRLAGLSNTSNTIEAGYWREVALAAESLAGTSSPATDTVSGYMLRAAVALEGWKGTSGAEENSNYYGLLKRIVDALEVATGVTSGSLERRLEDAAAALPLVTLAATGAQPTVMGAPPTITLGVLNAGTTIPGGTTTYNWNSASLLRTSGNWKQLGAVFPDTLAGRGATATYLMPSSDTGYAFAAEIIFTGRYLEPQMLTKGYDWQLMVKNGGVWEYVALPRIASGGGSYRCLIDFGAVVTGKHCRLEHQSDGQMGLLEIRTESTATLTAAPAYTDRVVVISDSHGGQSGVTVFRDAASYMVCKELGFGDHRISPVGGTGYVNDGGTGTLSSAFARWATDVIAPAPTMVIVLLGSNDVNRGTDATIAATLPAKLDELRAALPHCLVHVFAPVNGSAPTLPTGYAGCYAAIEAACAGRERVWFHDISDVTFTKWDGAHGDTAGHLSNYKAWYNKIAAVHGLHTVV